MFFESSVLTKLKEKCRRDGGQALSAVAELTAAAGPPPARGAALFLGGWGAAHPKEKGPPRRRPGVARRRGAARRASAFLQPEVAASRVDGHRSVQRLSRPLSGGVRFHRGPP